MDTTTKEFWDKINKYPKYHQHLNCVVLRKVKQGECDELRVLAKNVGKEGVDYDVINVPNQYNNGTFPVKCIIKKETNDYWEVIELWSDYTRYYKKRGLF